MRVNIPNSCLHVSKGILPGIFAKRRHVNTAYVHVHQVSFPTTKNMTKVTSISDQISADE